MEEFRASYLLNKILINESIGKWANLEELEFILYFCNPLILLYAIELTGIHNASSESGSLLLYCSPIRAKCGRLSSL